MTTVVQFAILGLGIGALYSLAALGMVLIYRGSGVINFGHGAVGMVGTYLFWILHDEHNQSFIVAFIPSVLLCALIGAVIQVAVMWPLRDSSPLSRVLATLGVLATLQGLVALRYHQALLVVSSSLPQRPVRWGSLSIGENYLWILLVVAILAIACGIIYRYTRFGLATSAVAESPRIAGHLGYSVNRIAMANWAIGSALAAVAGILLAPITGLQTTALTLLVVPALAAALVGSMVSFPVTVLAGLTIGVAESELTRYVSTPGWSSAVPFLLVLVVLLARGHALPGRGQLSLKLPRVGSGEIRRAHLLCSLVIGVVIVLVVPLDWVDGATTTIVTAVILLSVVVVTGYAGQVSLAQVALSGCGALVAGHIVTGAHLPFIAALLIGALAAVPIGVVIGLPALRARGPNLAIVTLTLSVAVEALIFDSSSLTGGDFGLQVGNPKLFGLPIDTISHPRRYALVALALFVILAIAIANLRRGRSGRRLLSVRANERAAASLGISVVGAKLYAFALSAMVAAVGGILLAFEEPSITYSSFQSFGAVTYVADSVIGGLGMLSGPLWGGTLQPGGLGTNVGNLFGASIQNYLVVASGILLIVILIRSPDGVAARVGEQFNEVEIKVRRAMRVRAASPQVPLDYGSSHAAISLKVPSRTLAVSSVSVRFGSTFALRDLSLDLVAGEVVGLIGPNGAGKTTLMDVITGFVPATQGRVVYDGKAINRWSPRRRSGAGIARSFQSLELFEDMTVLENLLVASESRSPWSYATDLVWPGSPSLTAAAAEAVRTFGLSGDLTKKPSELPHGRRRLVAIARAIASEPSILLLDEAAAGLSEEERNHLSTLVRALAAERNMSILLIEHDVDLVMRTSDRVVALEFGEAIASGTPAAVRSDPRVVSSYLGSAVKADGEPEASAASATFKSGSP